MPSIFNWPSIMRVSIRYGLAMGVVGFILLMILYYTGNHPFLIPVFLDYRIVLFAIIYSFALKEIRDYYHGGILHFWQGMVSCLLMTLLFSLVASIGIYTFARYNTAFVESYIRLSMIQVKAFPEEEIERMGRDVYEAGITALKQANAYFLASRYLSQSFIISFFISIIISVILRRQPKTN